MSKLMETGRPAPMKWLSPEAIHGHAYNQKSDTWAYGVLCWEIFACPDPPFKYSTDDAVIILNNSAERLCFPAGTPSVFESFIHQNVWTGAESRRYTVLEVLRWIEQHIAELAGR
uniref:Protein kinase domain-containing protein n=1 Tax=Globodera pallida TaxID=36090 RepID=A0A183CBD2_GLOPA